MPSRKVAPPTFEELITQIWGRGDAGIKPRFCVDPDQGILVFFHEPITHYDFAWEVRGKWAKLFLYQTCLDGEVTYGAVLDAETTRLGEIDFNWDSPMERFAYVTKRKTKC